MASAKKPRHRAKKHRLLGVPLAAALGAAAIAAPAPGLLPVGELREHFVQNPKLSGTTLVGLGRGSGTAPLDLRALQVDLPAGAKGMLCLDLATRDGRYTASQDFRLQAPGPGPADLGLTSQKSADLRAYLDLDLAVSARLRVDCEAGDAGIYVAGRWRGSGTPDLIIFLNTKLSLPRAQLLDARGAPLLSSPIGCDAITAGARTAFDHICRIPMAAVRGAEKVRQLQISLYGTSGGVRSETYLVSLNP